MATAPETTAPESKSGTPKAADAPPREATPRQAFRSIPWSGVTRAAVSVVLILLLFGVAGRVFVKLAEQKEPAPRAEVVPQVYNVRTFPAERRDLQEIISGFGTAKADRQVMVSSEVAGLVVETLPDLEVGVRVSSAGTQNEGRETRRTTGDLLIRIDSATYDRRVEQLRRGLDQDDVEFRQITLEEANEQGLVDTLERNLETAKEELASKQRVSRAGAGNKTQTRAAEQEVRRFEELLKRQKNTLNLFAVRKEAARARKAGREAELEVALLDVERTEIRPPFVGVVSEVSVEEGQYVRPGDPLIELTDLDHIEVPVSLTQSQFARVEPLLLAGERPSVELAENETAAPAWTGELVRAAPIADEATRTVNVFVEVDNSVQRSPLLPGTFVHARIQGPVLKNVIVVPRDALIRQDAYVVAEAEPETDAAGETGGDADPRAADTPEEADEPEVGDEPEAPSAAAETPRFVARRRGLKVGRTLQTFAVIEGGLEPGEEVVMTNLDILSDGVAIRAQEQLTVEEELGRQRTESLRLAE